MTYVNITAETVNVFAAVMKTPPVIIVGAGIGGLSAAIALAAEGVPVTVIEAGSRVGGKMRELTVAGQRIDSGPTVLTMRWVFEDLLAPLGAQLADLVNLIPLSVLARHAWNEREKLDLHADPEMSAAAIGAFAGAKAAHGFTAFCAEAKRCYGVLRDSYIAAQRPNPLSLSWRIGLHRVPELLAIQPFSTLWSALSRHFEDDRLRQLFGRYATYCGSSPFEAPATLMLIAHVEQEGVWCVEGGLQRLAEGLEQTARRAGVTFHFDSRITSVDVKASRAVGLVTDAGGYHPAAAVVLNSDVAALAGGLFGAELQSRFRPAPVRSRSLSAITWSAVGTPSGFDLSHHNVFFGGDYRGEFADLASGRLPSDPTVYLCAQDRGAATGPAKPEKLFTLINAPAIGDTHVYTEQEIAACRDRTERTLKRCGLSIAEDASLVTTPSEFHRLFPGTGGALYGRVTHGWGAAFQRPQAKTSVHGLYLAGGSAHPGAGVPMAALSGRLAAQRLLMDQRSTRMFHQVATSGGTSTRQATAARTP